MLEMHISTVLLLLAMTPTIKRVASINGKSAKALVCVIALQKAIMLNVWCQNWIVFEYLSCLKVWRIYWHVLKFLLFAQFTQYYPWVALTACKKENNKKKCVWNVCVLFHDIDFDFRFMIVFDTKKNPWKLPLKNVLSLKAFLHGPVLFRNQSWNSKIKPSLFHQFFVFIVFGVYNNPITFPKNAIRIYDKVECILELGFWI